MATTETTEPTYSDQLAEARKRREADSAADGRPTPEQLAGGAPADQNGGGQSMEQMEANGTAKTTTDDDGQIAFVWEHGRKVPISSIVKRGTPVEYRVKFGGISVKGRGEPVPLEAKDMMLIGRYYSGGLNFVPTHDDAGDVEKVTLYATLNPQGPPVDVNSPEGQMMLGGPSIETAVRAALDDAVSADDIRRQVEQILAER